MTTTTSKISRRRFERAAKAYAEERFLKSRACVDEGIVRATECRYVPKSDENEDGAFLAFRNIGTVTYEEKEDEDEDDEVGEDFEEDEDVVKIVARRNNRNASGSRARVEVDVIYSASYEVPVLCLRAFDSHNGSALNLDQINGAVVTKFTTGKEEEDVFTQLLAPWDRQKKLPKSSTGGGWLAIHPCETSKALDVLMETSTESSDTFPFERWLRYAASRLKIDVF
jgi:hypothetical protein